MKLPEIGDWSSFEELARLQDARLDAVLAAAARSPFYQRRGVPADLTHAEPTTTADLRDAYPFGMLAVDRAELATYHESSGSSGAPTASYYTAADWEDLAGRFARKWTGIRESDTFLVRTPYALMITGHLAHAAARRAGATVVPADNRSSAMPYGRLIRVLHDLDVTVTWSLPTETLLWVAAARLAGYEPGRDFPALRALFVAGEPLSPARRARIGALWGVPVVEEYGATEAGSLAGVCPHGRLHLWADRVLVEVRDPATGQVKPDGRGRLVVTPLYRDAMPLLRYELEDEVEVTYRACACGWWLPDVWVLGRSAHVGHAVTQVDLEEQVFSLPAEFGVLFWRARIDGARLEIQIEVNARHRAAATRALAAAVTDAYALDVTVDAVPPGRLVPVELLTAAPDVLKPRMLFGPGEPWDAAHRYY
ncbi:phenylacetate--CoA ligase family protein [Cryptosporangium aurantiacum]|uniref:Phenylacetate-CoA ligase n=1 Tax=Cryptosporangium aurantiacum TaxID=134849 RepID=A0A1M7KXL5_9ACTN|nr:AMP-binding protein [Cryptosporangium aurantiacum]SHM70284.1 phenylacetate-CoA ligase [Cryptosporangium aurantiacum]